MAESKADKKEAKVEKDESAPAELVVKDSTREQDDKASATDLPGADLKQAMDAAEKEAATPPADEKPVDGSQKRRNKLSRKQLWLIVAGVIVVLAILFAVPLTRYGVLGVFIKRDVTVTLLDSKTNKPVSNVTVSMNGASTTTDAKGMATLKAIAVGTKKLTTHKKYYKDLSKDETVPLTGTAPSFSLTIEATGRQVPVTVVNKLTKKPIEGAEISALDTSSKTDKNGEAVVVLPADKAEVDATVTGNTYNKLSVKVTVTEQKDDKNTFALVPSGKLYFLSKRSGTIDVLKSNLDGSGAGTVLKGTGKEEDGGTVLLASRDWKYLALLARRDSDRPKLYLIETGNGKLSTIDEGDVAFTAIGWYNNHFIYTLQRDKLKNWEPKRYALKSFNAATKSIAILDETGGSGSDDNHYTTEYMGNVYLLNNEIVYTKSWYAGFTGNLTDQRMTFNSVRPDGGDKKVLRDFPAAGGFNRVALVKPQEVYFSVYTNNSNADTYWEYEDGKVTQSTNTDQDYGSKFYPTYLISPSGNAAFWYDIRDGKNTLFVGDSNGGNGKEIMTLSEYVPYGWFTDNYLLVSKGGSELYILSRANPNNLVKVTDYHKPRFSYYGYGYGYGGF